LRVALPPSSPFWFLKGCLEPQFCVQEIATELHRSAYSSALVINSVSSLIFYFLGCILEQDMEFACRILWPWFGKKKKKKKKIMKMNLSKFFRPSPGEEFSLLEDTEKLIYYTSFLLENKDRT
jgi:hypothetical protein